MIVLEHGEKWSKVTYGSATGYVKSQFLAFAQPEQNSWTPQPARVAAAGTQLRSTPQNEAGLLAAIPAGDYLLVIQVSADWCQCEYEGQMGYAPTKSLEFP